MVKTKAQEIMYAISEVLYRNGKYGMERIAIVCEIISKLMHSIGWDNNLNFDRNYFDNIINPLIHELNINSFLQNRDIGQFIDLFVYLIKENKQDIANALKQLVENDKKSSNIIPTDDFSVKIMQVFAKKMYKGGIYIDPCVGTGRLLAGLGANKYCGFDIDRNAITITDAYLNLIEREKERKRLDVKLSTENFLYRGFGLINQTYNPTYIFDPPLNDSIEITPLLKNVLNRVGVYSWGKNIPSEYAFLTKILFETNTDICNFVCIVSNSFLSATDKFKSSFRKYLLENSVIAVIQSNFSTNTKTQKLILVGKSNLGNFPERPIYFITPKNENIEIKDIENVAQKCLNGKTISDKDFYDIFKIKTCTLQELRELKYEVAMPQYFKDEINLKKIESLNKISEKLQEDSERLFKSNVELKLYLNNLLSGIKNIKPTQNTYKEVVSNEHKNWFDYPYSDLNNAIGIFSGDSEVDWTPIDFINKNYIDIEVLDSCIYNLRQLFNAKRLRYINNKLEVYSKKDLPIYKESEPFSSYIIKSNNEDEFYKKITCNLSPRQIEYFNTYIKYYFDYNDDNEKSEENKKLILSFGQFSTSEKHSNIATLKALGLIYDNPTIDEGIEKYLPYVAILHIKGGS